MYQFRKPFAHVALIWTVQSR